MARPLVGNFVARGYFTINQLLYDATLLDLVVYLTAELPFENASLFPEKLGLPLISFLFPETPG